MHPHQSGPGPVIAKQLGRCSQRTTVGTGRTRGGVGRHILLGVHCLSQGHDHPVPCKVYARLEANEEVDSEQPTSDGEKARSTLIAYDAVSADWIDSRQEPFFVFDEGLERRVNAYWGGMFEGRQSDIPDDPYESVPAFRVELSLPRCPPWMGQVSDDHWVQFELGESGEHEVDVFRGLFDPEPAVRRISGAPKPVSPILSTQLSTVFDMDCWPNASASELKEVLDFFPPIEQLIAFDVGQGSATCLALGCLCLRCCDALDLVCQGTDSCDAPSSVRERHCYCSEVACPCGRPICYFDLGCGVYRNDRTRPENLRFCNCNDPPVILSHWDADHWAGAYRDSRFLESRWVAPRQHIGPSHAKFASKILQSGGSILIVPGGMAPVTWNGCREEVTLLRASGRSRNDSGLVMKVRNWYEDKNWLLTGDADYGHIPNPPSEAAAITVPHHGASKCRVSPPKPSSKCASRLLYSFGPGNEHGRYGVSHPRRATVDAHVSRQLGWSSPGWNVGTPGHAVARGTTLATAQHPRTHLGWAAAGWDRIPPPPCHLMRCLRSEHRNRI